MAAGINRAILRPVPFHQPIRLDSIDKELKRLEKVVSAQTRTKAYVSYVFINFFLFPSLARIYYFRFIFTA